MRKLPILRKLDYVAFIIPSKGCQNCTIF